MSVSPPSGQRVDPLVHAILTSRVYEIARQQPVFSFKLRGAYNRMAHLTPEERAEGVITASAGNHAQGVAYSARKLGVRAVIVMPQTTPTIKVDAVRAMGAEVVLAGDTYGDAKAHCDTLVTQTGMTFIHPFDDPLVIAGQGTIGAEILRHSQDRLSAVFVPVGGGDVPLARRRTTRAPRARRHLRRRRRGSRSWRADVCDRPPDRR